MYDIIHNDDCNYGNIDGTIVRKFEDGEEHRYLIEIEDNMYNVTKYLVTECECCKDIEKEEVDFVSGIIIDDDSDDEIEEIMKHAIERMG